ncbi:MAG: hypothetical protein J1F10_07665 [Muribaculaceae bacterium]|nr:hypothetical protein [Muribaculaceae bacterium]
MTLEQAIAEYRQLKITEGMCQAIGRGTEAHTNDTISFFNRVNNELPSIRKQTTTDFFYACLLFSEMSMRKIGGDMVPILAYYYGTKAISQNNIPENSHIDARRLRLFTLFQNLDKFNRFITFAQAPLSGYEGSLNEEEFFDFLIMSDAYLVWDSDNSSNLLNTIKRLTTQHEANHPHYNKNTIISEGAKAHNALFNIVSMTLSPR